MFIINWFNRMLNTADAPTLVDYHNITGRYIDQAHQFLINNCPLVSVGHYVVYKRMNQKLNQTTLE